jgi:Na+-driven multidrug efflux pump
MVYCAYAALRRPQYRIFESARVEPKLVRATTLLALPQFVFLILMVVPEPITVALLAPLGAAVVGGFRALSLVSDLTWALPGALGSASEIVLGQRIGAGDLHGARKFSREAIRIALVLCTLVGAVVALLAWPLATALTFNAALGSAAAAPLALHMVTLPLKGYAMTLLAPIRAAGDTGFAMWVGLATGGVVLTGLSLGILLLHLGLWAVPATWIVAWAIRCGLTFRRERSGDWARRTL